MKPVEIRAQAGIRNDLPVERFAPGDLLYGDNIELDETGKVYRRLGVAQALTGAFHSLWGDEKDTYCVRAGQLTHLAGTVPTTIQPVSGQRVAYQRIVNHAFWTDGRQTGVAQGATSRPAGLQVPAAPSVALTSGSLRAGTYLFCITHVRDDGHESGASPLRSLDVPENGGFTLTFSAAPAGVMKQRIYISECGGELPYLAATLTASSTALTYKMQPVLGIPVRTRHLGPPPAGQALGYFNGRLYVASGQFLWYSLPYEYELFDLASGYLAFTSQVKTIAPVSDGLFVGSENETVFLAGSDPAEFVRLKVAGYGTVLGTEREIPVHYLLDGKLQAPAWMWASKRGVCMGTSGGVFKELTGGRYQLPAASSGASLFKIRGGTPQFITSLFA